MDPTLQAALAQLALARLNASKAGAKISPEDEDAFIAEQTQGAWRMTKGQPVRAEHAGGDYSAPVPGADAGGIRSAIDHFADGVLGGVGEKIGAAGASLWQHGNMDNYRFNLEAMRARFGNERTNHPVASAGGEVAGLVASPLNKLAMKLPGVAAKAPLAGEALGMGAKMAQAAKAGAIGGAVYGAGAAGPSATSTALGAAGGAIGGAVAGGVLPPVAAVLGPIVSALAAKLGFVPPTDAVLRALEEAGLSPEQVAKAPPTMLAHILPDLARTVRSMSSKARGVIDEGLTGVQQEQLPQVQGQLERGLNVARGDIGTTAKSIAASKAAQAAPAYDKAYAEPPIDDPNIINTIIGSPYLTRAYNAGRAIAHEEGVTLPALVKPVDPAAAHAALVKQIMEAVPGTSPEAAAIIAQRGAQRAVQPPLSIPVQGIDYMKRGMWDLTHPLSGADGMKGQLGRVLRNKMGALMARVDELRPSYANARAGFAGHAEAEQAIEMGKEFGSASTKLDDVKDAFTELSPSVHDLYRRSAMNDLLTRLEGARGSAKGGADLIAKFYSSVGGVNKVRALFPDAASYKTFDDAMQTLAKQNEANSFIRVGSQTADKEAAKEAFADGDAARKAGHFLSSPIKATKAALAGAVERSIRVGNRESAERIAPQLVARGPDLKKLLEALLQAPSPTARDALRRQALATRVGGVVGGAAGPALDGLFGSH